MSRRRLHCAIYTRKSTDEGLDQAFNSLDAQREACAAYIKSQAGEGWTCLKAHYDDGGFSGGTMQRPALQQLLADIGSGKVDTVVVYKVDRLTRSLADFAKMVEVFDTQGVSFVSVTQAFNTTTSMGRLTLNVLLSFAQFEREVTAERIRDKIAASKKKGMWMGGVVPLGYDVEDRELVINPAEAKTVRKLFRLYLKHGNVRLVKEESDRLGLRTKSRKPNSGTRQGAASFTRGHIYKLLANPIYAGEISHKGERHPGEHEAIIDRETWEAVQRRLRRNAVVRSRDSNTKTQGLLAGLMVDETGERLAPTYAIKSGRRYRYYVSKSLKEKAPDPGSGWRLPAPMIEGVVVNEICRLLREKPRLIDALSLTRTSPRRIKASLSQASGLADRLLQADPPEQRRILLELVSRIELRHDLIRISLYRSHFGQPASADKTEERQADEGGPSDRELTLDAPVTFKRRGVEMKLVIVDGGGAPPTPDPNLIAAVAQARDWFARLKGGQARSVRDIASGHAVDRGDVSRLLPLALLAPDIVEAILEGRQPLDLTASRLKRTGDLPPSWVEQRRLLGFD